MTRDSWVWWLGILGAVIVYLSNAAPPTEWSYKDWLQAFAAVVATVSGKLATSPLKGATKDEPGVKPSRFLGLLIVLAVFSPAACAGKTPATVPAVALSDLARFAQRVEQAGQIAAQAQQLEIEFYHRAYVSRETHETIQRGLLALAVAVEAGLDVAATRVSPQSLTDALGAISAALARVEADTQAVSHPTVRSVLQTMVQAMRVVLQFLPGESAPAVAAWHTLVLDHGGVR